jgi:type IV secretion system protein VirB8
MKKETQAALDAYYADGDSWAHDRQDGLRKSRKAAWIFAGVAAAIALLEALALVLLTPLKTVEPYTLMVDRQTGFVQALRPLDPQLISADRALTQSFLVQYVIAREGFSFDTVQSDYRKIGLWSAGSARSSYLSGMQAGNPDSPLARYPRSTTMDVAIRSVTSMTDNSAMVRFDTRRRDANGQTGPARAWVAVLRYGYTGEPMSVEDRLINPLGFKVERYRRSAETPPMPEPAPVQPGEAAIPDAAVVPGQTFNAGRQPR